jgi:predicted XRE-type DNA-binding protein
MLRPEKTSLSSKRRRKVRRERNVFDDLGFSPEEAAALHMKSTLHSKIVCYAKSYSQSQLQKVLGEPEPRISDLLRGKISKFSLETLVNYAEALHMRPEIRTHEPIATLQVAGV